MADISDVERALAALLVQIVYPGGTGSPSALGAKVRIYRGAPSTLGLNADLADGVANISVFPEPDATRETTRYPRIWRRVAAAAPTLTVVLADGVATFGGSGGAGQNAGLLVAGTGYAVAVGAADTPESVAAAFAALIDGATADGARVGIAGATIDAARVEGSATAQMEVRRQEQGFCLTLWCPDPGTRDGLASLVDTALASLDWIALDDGTSGRLLSRATRITDQSENANLYRRDLIVTVEYATVLRQTVAAMLFGIEQVSLGVAAILETAPQWPTLGAIRFDAWYDPSDTIDRQCAAALSGGQWNARLPPSATIAADGTVTWPLAAQSVIDAEIAAAVAAGLTFWAFDAYAPGDGLSRALQLYLSSPLRAQLQFCMLGQSSAWADATTADGYSATFHRDIAMMSQPGYVQTAAGRPLYLVLDAGAAALAALPAGGIAGAIATIRARAQASGAGDPYIVWLSGAALADYDNTEAALKAGADAAGAYASPRYEGVTLPYAALVSSAETDWTRRAAKPFPMIPTAMSGWDQRPLIETPQPFYPIPAGLSADEYYLPGTAGAIAQHVASMAAFILAHPSACPSGIGLIYAWNELAEGGWIMPTLAADGADRSRADAIGSALASARAALATTRTLTS